LLVLLANLILRAFSSARRILDAEALTVPGAGYAQTQHDLLKIGLRILIICAPLWLIGALLR